LIPERKRNWRSSSQNKVKQSKPKHKPLTITDNNRTKLHLKNTISIKDKFVNNLLIMALVNVLNMVVLENPTNFLNPFQFEITFECLDKIDEDLEWKVVYVGSAESASCDQVLDEILVGPVPVGQNKFILEAGPPNRCSIPDSDILGVTVVLVTCSYREQEFARVGYYINNEYVPFEGYSEEEHGPPPQPLDLSKVVRTILAEKPRVTRFPINWSPEILQTVNYNMEDQSIQSRNLEAPLANLISPDRSSNAVSKISSLNMCDDDVIMSM